MNRVAHIFYHEAMLLSSLVTAFYVDQSYYFFYKTLDNFYFVKL